MATRETFKILSGEELFHDSNVPLPFSVRDFWGWGLSGLAENGLRALVAEFLVSRAIGARERWRRHGDASCLTTANGARVDVKSAGYVQVSAQRVQPRPSFDVAPRRSGLLGSSADTGLRPADLYVFALHQHTDPATLDPCDVSQWCFHVVPTRVLDEHLPASKRIGLARVEALGGARVLYAGLAAAVLAAER